MERGSVGKYQLHARIGGGAVGVVYEGWDPTLARKVAIKLLPLTEAGAGSREQRSRFLREAKAAASLYHPNIVVIYDYGETESSAYIVMELVNGQSLEARLGNVDGPSVAETFAIMDGLLLGLQHSHERGIVHRDVKPANIILTPDGRVKISDFGIARLANSEMTRVGSVIGTPAYMSPEQVRGEQADPRSDIYSAGAVLYEMLLGRRPFQGSTFAVMHQIINVRPALPRDLLAAVSPGMDAVLATALSKHPNDRYRSAAEFARVLRGEFRQATPSLPRDKKTGGQAEHPVIVGPGTAGSGGASQTAGAGTAPGAVALTGTPHHGRRRGIRFAIVASVICSPLLGGIGLWELGILRRTADTGTQSRPDQDSRTAVTAGRNRDQSHPPLPDARSSLAPELKVLEDAVGETPCSLLSISGASPDSVVTGGLTALGSASELQIRAELGRMTASFAPAGSVTWDVRRIDGPYCGVLDVLRSARGGGAGQTRSPMLSLATPGEMSVTVPGSSAVLLLDYFAPDRTVTHINPPARPVGAALGSDTGFRVPVPGRTGLITLIVSPEALLPQVRPSHEAAADYLRELKVSLDRERLRGARFLTETLVIAEQAQ